MLKFEDLKTFDVAALGRAAPPKYGAICELPIDCLDPDPGNIRRHYDEASIAELANTINVDGLLEPIVVRENANAAGRYLVSYGHRRLRATILLGKHHIAAIINNDFDPFRQAIENLQREDLHPLDLAEWISHRESEGYTRVEIARRLGKPKSYITEIAQLASAPEEIKSAFRTRRIPDLRTAYLLTRKVRTQPDTVNRILSTSEPITRAEATAALSQAAVGDKLKQRDSSPDPRPASTPSVALAVSVDGRVGLLRLKPGRSQNHGVVCFEDGSEKAIALERLTLQSWTVI